MRQHFTRAILCIVAFSPLIGGCAWAAKSPFATGKRNNKAPIDVTSDSLEVLQAENKAIFSGHVVAIQGDVRLTADKMTVFYASAAEKKNGSKEDKKAAKKDRTAGGSPQGAIKKIVPEGHVFLATPEETASGADGLYDVEHQEIHLDNHIVLTRGKNVLKGDRLVYNFATGKSVVTGAGAAAQAGGKKERVHALFVPESSKNDNKEKEPDTKKDQNNQ